MGEVWLSVAGIYFFILLGFMAKRFFNDLDEKPLVTLSIYFLQPLLTFWGLSQDPITLDLLEAGLFYGAVVLLSLGVGLVFARRLFANGADRAIASVAMLIGNTGNLGIPLGIALFGEASVLYTTLINLVNVFFVYTFGVYFYSRGRFSIRQSLINILKLPVIYLALLAVAFNLGGIDYGEAIDRTLTMGAHASMVLQLLIFGFYLYSVQIRRLHVKLTLSVVAGKFGLIPLIGLGLLQLWPLEPMLAAIVLIQLAMPLAVANVNLAALYGCKPTAVTESVLLSSLLFVLYLPLLLWVVG
jgi:predicted permease